ncbi:MAG: hypothetical protein SPF57_11270, partial [Streptococcus orisratti]|uniref:hypothetical protein n=1 Tax=Streptococcus orisratti TaxID=114652 RepID=UPI002A90F02C
SSAFYTELGNSSISDEHAFFVALHFTTREKYLTENDKKKVFDRIEKHKKLHREQKSKNRNTNDYER